jgi:hypothetical protein
MIDILVTQRGGSWEFRREFVRRHILVYGNRGIFNRVQLRATARLLDVPPDADVQFLDAGTYETLAVLSPG